MFGRKLVRFALSCLVSATISGCLADTYHVSRQELLRVAQLPPHERNRRLRVVQSAVWSVDDLEETQPEVPDSACGRGYGQPARHRYELHTQTARHGGPAKPAEQKGDAEAALAATAAIAMVAATGAIVFGVTEGVRFDGWVSTRPHHSLLVVDCNGMRHWVSLSALTGEDVRTADHAVIADFGHDFEHLDRAPLSRRGFVYQAELGAATLGSTPEATGLGFAARAALGYMPTQTLGFLVGAQFATGSTSGAAGSSAALYADHDVAIHYRMFLQSELWLLAQGRLHAGPYLELGYARALEDTPVGTRSGQAPFAALGVALQLEWTTRLALTLRAGVAALPIAEPPAASADSSRLAAELTLGFSIY